MRASIFLISVGFVLSMIAMRQVFWALLFGFGSQLTDAWNTFHILSAGACVLFVLASFPLESVFHGRVWNDPTQ